ncbi:Fic family protein [Longimicrobium sp.]|uniref:Fic family protein n=1 Tax=Longimicrobium sp. TaxID=2029185 RepID=UPI002F93D64A
MDPRAVDATYRTFPPFSEWAKASIDHVRWDRYSAIVAERGRVSPDELARAREVVKRAAAVDTGAIEGLYDVDRGFTFTVATQAAVWEAAMDSKGQQVRALFESQLRAYDYVLDVATNRAPISETWIRTLHQELCAAQQTYSVMTEVGPQTHQLPTGEYKHLSNHVRLAGGGTHAYAPVDLVPAEMHRFCEVLRSEEFLEAHPVLQASYAHYAFVVIHPFADGNGRVARALASIFTYRAHSIPLMILVENRKEYLDSLAAADRGDYQRFTDFTMERALDSILLVNESLGAALSPQPAEALGELQALFTTRGGYTQEDVEKAGRELFEQVRQQFESQATRYERGERLRISVNRGNHYQQRFATIPAGRVVTSAEWDTLGLSFRIGPPVQAHLDINYVVAVPLNAEREDDISLVETTTQRRVFSARVSELVHGPTAALRMRLMIGAERIFGEALNNLLQNTRKPAPPGEDRST